MRYTIRAGVEHPYSALVSDNSRFLLPLIIVLAGVLYFSLHPYHFSKTTNPMTLGVYTINTPDHSSNNGSGSSSNDNGSSNLTPGASAQPIGFGSSNMQSTGTASGTTAPLTSTTAPIVGGRGGGDIGSTSTPPASAAVPAVTTVSTGCTVAVPSVCGVCSTPISLSAGQKSVLTATGQCIAVDP